MKGVGIVVIVTLWSWLLVSALEEGLVLNPAGILQPAGCADEKSVLDYTNLRTESLNCCNTHTCTSSSHSCCCGSTNPCCLLAVGSGYCCPDQCYPGTSPPVCCSGYACPTGNVCCDGRCCLPTTSRPSRSPTITPTSVPTLVATPLLSGTSWPPSPAPTNSPVCCTPLRQGRSGCGHVCDAGSVCCGSNLCCQAGEECYSDPSEGLFSYYCSASPRPTLQPVTPPTEDPSYSPTFLPTTSPSQGKPSLRPSSEPSLPPVPPPTPEPTVSFEPTPVAPMPAPSYQVLCCNPTYLGGGYQSCGVRCVAELTGTCCGTSNKCCQGTCKYDHTYGYSYCKAAPKTSTSSPNSSPTTGGGKGEDNDDQNNGGDSSSYSNGGKDDDSGPSSAIIAVSVIIPLLFVMSVAACVFFWVRKQRYAKLTQDPVSVSPSASSLPGIEITATVVQPAAEEGDIVVVVPAVIMDNIYPSVGAQEQTMGEVVNPSKPYYERRVRL
jgi:hypothetical protein